jgi:short-subunit dehydrogenase
MNAFPYVDKTALVTGASSGLGAEFARQLAQRGSNLILVARSTDRLRTLAAEIEQAHPVRVEVVPADLADRTAVAAVAEHVRGRVHLLVNNAGLGTYGPFVNLDTDRNYEQVLVNNAALVALTRALLPEMLDRHAGGVLNVASTIAFQPGPYQAVYETRASGVRVLALCPGPVQTGFLSALGDDRAARTAIYSKLDRADRVVTVGLRALDHDRGIAIPGTRNTLLAWGPRFTPRAVTARISGRLLRPATSDPSRA